MRVLIADDDPVSRRLLEGAVSGWGYAPVTARDGEEAWRDLCGDRPTLLAILDWRMPDLSGIEVVRRVRAQAREPRPYLLVLTGRCHKGDLVEAFLAGADDFLHKPFDDAELEVRLAVGRRVVELQNQLIASRERLRIEAARDPLTSMWNRRMILAFLHTELSRAGRATSPLSVALVDLDHFKRINDTHGHLAGDAVLQETAARMRISLRSYDFLGRYGGEEFLVLLPGCGSDEGRYVLDRLRNRIAAEPILAAGTRISVTCSIGLATTGAIPTFDRQGFQGAAESLLMSADAALYRAKALGRNRVMAAEGTTVAAE